MGKQATSIPDQTERKWAILHLRFREKRLQNSVLQLQKAVLQMKFGLLQRENRVLQGQKRRFFEEKGLPRSVWPSIKAAQNINPDAGMAFYDTPGLFFDSGALYDDAS